MKGKRIILIGTLAVSISAASFFASVVTVALVAAGCTFASFVSQTEKLLPVVVQGVISIGNIIALATQNPAIAASDKAIMTTASATVTSTLQELCGQPAAGATTCDTGSLVGQYQGAPASSKATLLEKIDTAIGIVNQNLTQILNTAHIFDATLASQIAEGVGFALSTILSIQSLWPAPTPTAAQTRMEARAKLPVGLVVPKHPPSRKDFVKHFNKTFASFPQYALR